MRYLLPIGLVALAACNTALDPNYCPKCEAVATEFVVAQNLKASLDVAASVPVHVGGFDAQRTSSVTYFQVYPHNADHSIVVTGNTLPSALVAWYHWENLNSVPCDVLGSPYPNPTTYMCGAISTDITSASLTVDSLTGPGYVYDASANDVATTITFDAGPAQAQAKGKGKKKA